MGLDHQEIENPEEQEVQQEDGEQKGKLDLTRHHKRANRTSKKRCWLCKSSGHYKRTCPSIKCFYCHKLGHMKKDCWKWKVNSILNRTIEEKKKRDRRKKWRWNKQKEHRRTTMIYKHRLKESEFIQRRDKWIINTRTSR